MWSVTDLIIPAFFLVWFVASVFAQFKNSKVRGYDYLGILPSFRFFAPRPVTRDIRVFAKGITENKNESAWKELFYADKKWYCFAWNAQHKLRKAVIDIYSDFDAFRESPTIWHVTFPYLIILNAANAIFENSMEFTRVQFMITCFAGHEESTHDIIFLSNEHEIGRVSG